MRFGRLGGPGTLVVDDVPEPAIGPGEVLVRLAACGICGTDLEKLRGHYQPGGRLGHEPAGVVAAVAPDVVGLSVGDRVAVHHHVPCLACPVCARGDVTYCPTYGTTNIDPGGFAEAFRVPAIHVARGAVHRLDDRIPFAIATLLEPAACALTALKRVGFRAGESVFVIGLGPVGLLYARLARALGASWVGGAELSPRRREAARAGGAAVVVDPRDGSAAAEAVRDATGGRGVDLAVVATGAPAAIALATRLPRPGGTVNLFGLPDPGIRLDADLQELYLRGIRIVPSYATTEADIDEVHARLRDESVSFDGLVTDTVPLARLADGFALAARPADAIKVAVTGPEWPG
ncbi:MAG TPA: alcohol dehydrogenase catalytic domain-containing protein [Thermoplasmata archaeon]|nr:alcohol dehydrogenase catalytic domain-containing protein [Thermoplasmata archaeon]